MKRVVLCVLLALPALAARLPLVALETEKGRIVVEVDTRHAPKTAANFLRYVDAGAYNGAIFHRTVTLKNQPKDKVKIEVIQGGPDPAAGHKDFEPVPLERTWKTGLRHVDGAISMARDEPDTATSDFFICLGDQPDLDFNGRRNPDKQGFAVFGGVVEGMEVVRAIQVAPAEGQTLKPAVRILKAYRLP